MVDPAKVKLGDYLWLLGGSRRLMVVDHEGNRITVANPEGREYDLHCVCFVDRDPRVATTGRAGQISVNRGHGERRGKLKNT